MRRNSIVLTLCALSALALATPVPAGAQDLPFYLSDRAGGTPTSMFGTYIRKGELVLYPFFEYYLDHNAEYSPNEFGFALDRTTAANSGRARAWSSSVTA